MDVIALGEEDVRELAGYQRLDADHGVSFHVSDGPNFHRDGPLGDLCHGHRHRRPFYRTGGLGTFLFASNKERAQNRNHGYGLRHRKSTHAFKDARVRADVTRWLKKLVAAFVQKKSRSSWSYTCQ